MKTLSDYIKASRALLQDEGAATRFSDERYSLALELAFDEAYRIRPDIFLKVEAPKLFGEPMDTEVPVPRGYQSAFLYYMCGHVQLHDAEDTQDNRASVFLNKFMAQLLVPAS